MFLIINGRKEEEWNRRQKKMRTNEFWKRREKREKMRIRSGAGNHDSNWQWEINSLVLVSFILRYYTQSMVFWGKKSREGRSLVKVEMDDGEEEGLLHISALTVRKTEREAEMDRIERRRGGGGLNTDLRALRLKIRRRECSWLFALVNSPIQTQQGHFFSCSFFLLLIPLQERLTRNA